MTLDRRRTKPFAPLFAAALTALLLGAGPASAATYSNPTAIRIPASDSYGPASPYPSSVSVSGASGPVTDVNVTLHRVGHTEPSQLEIVLVSPSGDSVELVAGNCGYTDIEDDIWTVDQQAPAPMPEGADCPDVAYRPNPSASFRTDPPAPAPPGPHGTSLDDFNRENANGTWSLYVYDLRGDGVGDVGDIELGWTLTLTTGSSSTAIPGSGSSGPANPYPLTRTVSGEPGIVTDVNVAQDGIWHQRPDDLDLLLVGPRGQAVVLMSDACGSFEVSAYGWAWDDEAPLVMPDGDEWAKCDKRFYRPTNWGSGDVWPAPAPGGPFSGSRPYSASLSVFDLTDPNGEWRLYVQDDTGDKVGFFTSQLFLDIDTRPKASVALTESAVTVAEGSSRPLTLLRSGPATTGAGAVTVSSVPAAAGSGTDFEPVSTTVQFAPGETEKTVSVQALTDGVHEADENFVVSLSSASGDAVTGSPSSATVTIPANDAPPAGGSGQPPPDGAGPAGFGPDPLVTLRLATGRITSRGPVPVSIVNGNGFAITGSLSGRTAKRIASPGKKDVSLGRRSFAVGANARKTVRFTLPAKLRSLLRRNGKLALRLTAKVVDPAGNARAVGSNLTPRLIKSKNTKRRTR